MVEKLVLKMGATLQSQVVVYKAVVQSVLLYDSESWVLTRAMLKVIEGFHHQVGKIIMGMKAQRMISREGGWNPVAKGLETSGISIEGD